MPQPCERLRLSGNHRGNRIRDDCVVGKGRLRVERAAEGPRLGQVTRLPWCARRALAGCAAVPDFQRTENTGNYPYKWIRVKGRSRIFPDGSRPAAGRVAASVLRQVVAAAEQTARVLGKTAACVGAWTPGGGTSMRRTSQSIPSWSVSEMMSGFRGFSCRVGLACAKWVEFRQIDDSALVRKCSGNLSSDLRSKGPVPLEIPPACPADR